MNDAFGGPDACGYDGKLQPGTALATLEDIRWLPINFKWASIARARLAEFLLPWALDRGKPGQPAWEGYTAATAYVFALMQARHDQTAAQEELDAKH